MRWGDMGGGLEADWVTGFQAFAAVQGSHDGRDADESDDRGNGRKRKSRGKDELQINSAGGAIENEGVIRYNLHVVVCL